MVTLLKNQMKSAMMAKPDTSGLVSGSSTVKVSLSGRVSTMARFAATSETSAAQVLDNTHSGSRLTITASGAVNKKVSAAATAEIGINGANRYGSNFENGAVTPGLATRVAEVAITHVDMGTVSLGHSWYAGGSLAASFAGTDHVLSIWGPGGDGIKATAGTKVADKPRHGADPLSVFGGRTQRIRYDTPSLMGVTLSASYNQNRSWGAGLSVSGLPGVKDVDFALDAGIVSTPAQPARGGATLEPADDKPATRGSTGIGVSAGFKHASGLNFNGAYGQERAKNGPTAYGWMVDAGWTGKLTDAGDTSITVGYGRWGDGVNGRTTRYHFAISQNIASAGTDVYFGVGYDTGVYSHTVAHAEDAVFTAGSQTGVDTACGAASGNDAAAADGADDGDMCAASRDGVIVIIAGVRVRF